MNTYRVVHREILVTHFYIDAESESEAIEELHRLEQNGEIEYNDLAIEDIEEVAELVEED